MPDDDRDFRLSRQVVPRRYQATLSLDLEARAFHGAAVIGLSLEQAVTEIALHAISLELQAAELRLGGRSLRPRLTLRPVSETVLLEFDESLPAGPAELSLRWSGRFTD